MASILGSSETVEFARGRASPVHSRESDDGAELVNLRDLGGLRVVGGGLTRPGVLYRSDAPYHGDRIPMSLPSWPPALVVDLRSDHELREPHPWREVSEVLRLPLMGDAAVVTEATASHAADRDYLERIYCDVLDSAAAKLASLIPRVAAADSPVLIHCAAGKDRTGLAAAVLLLAAGVGAADVTADYTATAQNMSALLNRVQRLGLQPPDAPVPSPTVLAAPEHLMAMVITLLTEESDGIAGWARRHGVDDDDVVRWRAKFVDRTGG